MEFLTGLNIGRKLCFSDQSTKQLTILDFVNFKIRYRQTYRLKGRCQKHLEGGGHLKILYVKEDVKKSQ